MIGSANRNRTRATGLRFLAALALLVTALPARGATCQWQLDPYDRYDGVIFPDANTTYWRISLQFEPGTAPRFRIRGSEPHARYMGFMLYRTETGNAITSLSDEKIAWEKKGGAGTAEYTAWLLPRGTEGGSPGVLHYPRPHLTPISFELWYRVYLPDTGTDDAGGAPLPTVEALGENGEPIACPVVERERASSGGAGAEIPLLDGTDEIRFHSSNGRTTSANPDNYYGVARLPFTAKRDVAVIRIKPPEVVRRGQTPKTANNARYWSLCLGGVSGETSACLADPGVVPDANGLVTVVIGPDSLEAAVQARGMHFIPTAKAFFPLVLYRNLLAKNHPEMPTGKLMSTGEFLKAFPELPDAGTRPKAKFSVLPTTPPRESDKTIHFALSRDLFLGLYWYQSLTHADRARSAHQQVPMIATAGDSINKMLTERTGYSVKISMLSTDTIAAAMAREAIDFALVPGYQYTWLKRFYPQIDPIAHGARGPSQIGTTRVHLLALPQTLERYGAEPGRVKLSSLRGARLAIYHLRSESLFALYQGLLTEGANPEGFFRLPLRMNESALDALACVRENEVVRGSEELSACADVALIDDETYHNLVGQYPGYMQKQFDILWTSPPIPLAMVVYLPAGTRRPLESRVFDALDQARPTFNVLGNGPSTARSRAQANILEMGLRMAFGFPRFSLAGADYAAELEQFEDRMQEIPEYFLPLSFFPAKSFREAPQP